MSSSSFSSITLAASLPAEPGSSCCSLCQFSVWWSASHLITSRCWECQSLLPHLVRVSQLLVLFLKLLLLRLHRHLQSSQGSAPRPGAGQERKAVFLTLVDLIYSNHSALSLVEQFKRKLVWWLCWLYFANCLSKSQKEGFKPNQRPIAVAISKACLIRYSYWDTRWNNQQEQAFSSLTSVSPHN